MQYSTFVLGNGLRIIHLPSDSPVSYCGFTVNAGTRDELPGQNGLAHFVEHLLFKGTKKRKSRHILNRMETVGGELNAYTTKEETVIYSISLSEDIERAVDLLSDLVFNSQFPADELEKEREVIIDEINSYQDTPSELIFDDFDDLVFSGNELGHNILGNPESLETFTSDSCRSFVEKFYRPGNMVFFSSGKTPFSKIVRLANKYMSGGEPFSGSIVQRTLPVPNPVQQVTQNKDLHQTHVIVGGNGYSIYDDKLLGFNLLNNILGGNGMNCRLNLSLREKYGLVYSVWSGASCYTDTGIFTIYFGCDHESKDKCLQLVHKELKRLRDTKLSGSQLAAAVKQWKGQLGVSVDQHENYALGSGKRFLRYNECKSLSQLYQEIDALTADLLLGIANEIYAEEKLFSLIYTTPQPPEGGAGEQRFSMSYE
jgi:predicted Zn-dependent peptidase